MLNPQSPIPLYHQLADILTDQIRSGIYQPGDLIPPETLIAKDYQIGRPTVRQAMDTMVRKGLIERKRGSGTFVKEQGPDVDIFSLAGTSQAFLTRGILTTSKIVVPVSVQIIQDDQGNPFNSEQAYFFSRLTCVDKKPVLLEDIYLHLQLFKGLERVDLENRSLSMVVLDQYYMKPEKGHQTFKLSFLSREKSELMELKPSDSILEVQRKLDFPGYDQAVFSRLYCKTDRFAFSQTISIEG
ncbi:MAG: GntR family transcriptional regulator [Pseudomonadota bacterium]